MIKDMVLIPSSSGLKAGRQFEENQMSGSLNPFFIRSQGRTEAGAHIGADALGLNPFFIRSQGRTLHGTVTGAYIYRLNPFFIRSQGRTCGSAIDRALLAVLIPSSSGLKAGPRCAKTPLTKLS